MPYPTEHSCRLHSPDDYIRFRRNNEVDPNIIVGFKQAGGSEAQAFRYPVTKWDEAKAREHCQSHKGTFEAASNKSSEHPWCDIEEILQPALKLAITKKKYLVIPKGIFSHPQYGKLDFTEPYLQELQANFNNKVLGNTRPFIDVDHDEGQSAGWVNSLLMESDGLYAEIEWTDYGMGLIKSLSYRYFSPWISSYTNPETKKTYKNVFRGGALTNVPFLKMLPEITLGEKDPALPVNIKLNEFYQEYNMDLLKKIRELFKLDETVKDEEVPEKIKTILAEKEEKMNELGVKDTEIGDLKKKVTDLEEAVKKAEVKGSGKSELEVRLKEVEDDNKKLNTEIVDMKAKDAIDQAVKDGKIEPAKIEFWTKKFKESPGSTKEILDNLPKVITLGGHGNPNAKQESALRDEDKEALKDFGLTEEDHKKFGED